MGTVRLSSARDESSCKHRQGAKQGTERTSLANEEEEPDAAGQIKQERDGVAGIADEVGDGEEGGQQAGADGRGADGGGVEQRVGGRAVGAGGATDKGRGEAPGEADEDKGDDVVDEGGGGHG